MKIKKKIRVVIAGLGNRGYEAYGKSLMSFGSQVELVGIAEKQEEKLNKAGDFFSIPKERRFSSCEALLKEECFADVLILATLDQDHVKQGLVALQKGYDLLMEKPISPQKEECTLLWKEAKKYGRRVVICHVLRYAPLYRKAKEILENGEIGEVVAISASEHIGWFHYIHSFVRGRWAREEESSPIILQKCCHDLDLYLWLCDKTCKTLSSVGNLFYFSKENGPKERGKRCLVDCKAKETCIFDGEKLYLSHPLFGYANPKRRWPLDIDIPETGSWEEKREHILLALREGPYGRCVFECENNVPDHQVIQMEMTDGSTFSFTMSGFTEDISRYARIMGTKGELLLRMNPDRLEECEIQVRIFGRPKDSYEVEISKLAGDFSGHGGGDIQMLKEFFQEEREEGDLEGGALEMALESHYLALAAEVSRKSGGRLVSMEEFRGSLGSIEE